MVRSLRAVVALGPVVCTAPVGATTLVRLDLAHLTDSAQTVVHGRIVRSEPRWTDDHRRIVTVVTLRALETWKGSHAGTVTVLQPGGEIGRIGQRVEGVAALREGDEVVLFLARQGPAHVLVGLAQGVYRVERDPGGAVRAVPASTGDVGWVEARGGEARLARVPLALADLRNQVLAAAAPP